MNTRDTKTPILVWRFHDAPERLRALSEHGGDEDWLAEVPSYLVGVDISWMESGSRFGVCDVSEHPHPYIDGWVVRIGAHS